MSERDTYKYVFKAYKGTAYKGTGILKKEGLHAGCRTW